MTRLGDLGGKLYRGELAYNFVGKRMIWYGLSLLFIVLALTGLGARGLYLGVEFQGGAVFTSPPTKMSVEEARDIAQETSGNEARVQRMGNEALRIQVTDLNTAQSDKTRAALAEKMGIETQKLNAELVGPSWGDQVTDKALQGLLVFLALVTLYLAITFEWRMAVGALIALLFDLSMTIGVYAIVGFEVTPGTVVGVLTILGYSLYDTVVVFDKVKEMTANVTKQSRYTYSELANLAINSTVIRSINTSVVALLPVAGLLFIGSGLLGGGMLKDIALSLFVGITAGTYSSIVIATPVVVDLKSRQPEITSHEKHLLARRAKAAKAKAATEAAGDDEADSGTDHEDATAAGSGVVGQRRRSNNRGGGRASGRGRR